jgi:hypothetical protein
MKIGTRTLIILPIAKLHCISVSMFLLSNPSEVPIVYCITSEPKYPPIKHRIVAKRHSSSIALISPTIIFRFPNSVNRISMVKNMMLIIRMKEVSNIILSNLKR